MKKIIYIFAAIAAALLFNACEEDPEIPNLIDDNPYWNVESEDTDPDDAYFSNIASLEEFTSTSYPESSDEWTITDTYAELSDFSGLRDALSSADRDGRSISLIFSNLKKLPSAAGVSSGALYNCPAIVSVVMEKLTTIGDCVFCSCSNLKTVVIPNVVWMGKWAFRDCTSLSSVAFPLVTTIDDYAFMGCSSLVEVDLPAVTSIGSYSFHSCVSLSTVSFATNSGTELAFFGVTSNTVFNDVDTGAVTLNIGSSNSDYVNGNILTIGSVSVIFKEIILVGDVVDDDEDFGQLSDYSSTSYPATSDTWTINDSSAELSMFYGLRDALGAAYSAGREISLIFPNLEAVPTASTDTSGAFYDCDALISVDLPLVTSLVNWVFYSCSSLTSIDLPLVTSVGYAAFCVCSSLSSIDLPLVTSVGDYAFYGCNSLSSIDLPLVTSIGSDAFGHCASLSSVDLPLVTLVGTWAFYSCDVLQTVKLATSDGVALSSIGSSSSHSAFYDMTTSNITLTLGLANSGYVSGNTLTVGSVSETFAEIIMVDGNGIVYEEPVDWSLSEFSSSSYPTSTNNWNITDSSAEISDFYGLRDALYEADSAGRQISLTFPNLDQIPQPSVIISQEGAFYQCYALVSVKFAKATYLCSSTFRECLSLKSVYLPLLTEVKGDVFYECSALESIDLPSVTAVDDTSFWLCTSLVDVNIPQLISVGAAAFQYCQAITTMNLSTGDGVKLSSVDSYAFSSLTTSNITLTIGSTNSEYVSGNTLTVGDFSETFAEIIMVDGNGDVYVESEPDYKYLADYSSTSYPETSNTWTVYDTTAELSDLYNLRSALQAAESEGRQISLICPNLTEIPVASSSTYGAFYSCDALISVDMPAVTSVGNYAFRSCAALATVNMASVTTISSYAFRSCTALTTMSLATNDTAVWDSISSYAFYAVTTANISLTVGKCSSSYVSGNTLTVGSYSATFGQITVLYDTEDGAIPDFGYEELF